MYCKPIWIDQGNYIWCGKQWKIDFWQIYFALQLFLDLLDLSEDEICKFSLRICLHKAYLNSQNRCIHATLYVKSERKQIYSIWIAPNELNQTEANWGKLQQLKCISFTDAIKYHFRMNFILIWAGVNMHFII